MARKPTRNVFFDPFDEVSKTFYDGKRRFIDDLRGQLEEDSEIAELIQRRIKVNGKLVNRGERFLVVTFDRRKNDKNFSYGYFDVLLVLLDALSGGSGIRKPINQLRILHWNGMRRDLLKVIHFFAKNNPQIRARRILILPFSNPIVGVGVDHKIYLR